MQEPGVGGRPPGFEAVVLTFEAMPEGSQAGFREPSGRDGINRFFHQETDDEILSSNASFLLWD